MIALSLKDLQSLLLKVSVSLVRLLSDAAILTRCGIHVAIGGLPGFCVPYHLLRRREGGRRSGVSLSRNDAEEFVGGTADEEDSRERNHARRDEVCSGATWAYLRSAI